MKSLSLSKQKQISRLRIKMIVTQQRQNLMFRIGRIFKNQQIEMQNHCTLKKLRPKRLPQIQRRIVKRSCLLGRRMQYKQKTKLGMSSATSGSFLKIIMLMSRSSKQKNWLQILRRVIRNLKSLLKQTGQVKIKSGRMMTKRVSNQMRLWMMISATSTLQNLKQIRSL